MALIAAASLDPKLYYDINIDLNTPTDRMEQYQKSVAKIAPRPLLGGADDLPHLKVEKRDLSQVEEMVGNESLRGRTGGGVTLAVGMADILTQAMAWTGVSVQAIMKYWYHFAIMFEALFILTTIDTGTRIARFLLQEALGRVYQPFEKTDWLPGSILSTLVVTAGWGVLVYTGSIDTIWPMFGVANQLLAVVALCLVTTLLVNSGRGRYAWVTLLPMCFVTTTTLSAGYLMMQQFLAIPHWGALKKGLNVGLMLFVITCVIALLLLAVARWVAVWKGVIPVRPEEPAREPSHELEAEMGGPVVTPSNPG
jgi:carbon starvation protein